MESATKCKMCVLIYRDKTVISLKTIYKRDFIYVLHTLIYISVSLWEVDKHGRFSDVAKDFYLVIFLVISTSSVTVRYFSFFPYTS